jgi:hypothetical protein
MVRPFLGKANQPEALTRVTRQVWLMVRVVGGVTDSLCMPLKACGAHLVDAHRVRIVVASIDQPGGRR